MAHLLIIGANTIISRTLHNCELERMHSGLQLMGSVSDSSRLGHNAMQRNGGLREASERSEADAIGRD